MPVIISTIDRKHKEVSVNNSNGNPNISDTLFVVDTLTESAWHVIGPTGGIGVDSAWTTLNNIPDDVDWIEVKVVAVAFTTTGTVGSTAQILGSARKYNTIETALAPDNLIVSLSGIIDPNGDILTRQLGVFKIPVDVLRFEIYWSNTSSRYTSRDIDLVLIGYGYN